MADKCHHISLPLDNGLIEYHITVPLSISYPQCADNFPRSCLPKPHNVHTLYKLINASTALSINFKVKYVSFLYSTPSQSMLQCS